MTADFVSIHGRRLGLTPNGLLADGQLVGNPFKGIGKYVYVNSNVDGASGASPREAVGTLDEAFALCTASQGDTIIVCEAHSETVTGIAGIAHDVAGVSVIGLGTGDKRPTFLMDGANTVTYAITAADAYLENLVFKSGHSNVVACITTTKKNSWFYNCTFKNNTTNEDFLTPIKATSTTSNDSDGLRVVGCRWITSDADDLEFIELNGDLDSLVVTDNFVCTSGTASPLLLSAGTKIQTAALIARNILQSAGSANDLFIDNGGATNTGIVAYNLVGNLDVSGAQVFGVAAGLQFFENYMTSTSTESGGLQLTADTPNS